MQLPEGWQVRKFSDVLDIKNGRNQKAVEAEGGQYPILGSAGNVMGYATDYICDEGTTIIGRKGNISTPIYIDSKFWNVDTAFGLSAKDGLDKKYLYYYCLSYNFSALNRGTTIPSLVKNDLLGISITLPSLKEQKRIVAILDEAFAGINQAIANTERNLSNVRELFDGYLDSAVHDKKPLGNFVNIKTGKLDANAAVIGGIYPFFTCSREVYHIDNFAFDCEAVLLAGNNASGDFNVKHFNGKFNAYQRTYVITIKNEKELLYRFLYYQLIKSLKELKHKSVGAGTKFLKLGMIQNLEIDIPPIGLQQTILDKLENLSSETESLIAIYQKKLQSLTELKQSLLQKAFSGELTANNVDKLVNP